MLTIRHLSLLTSALLGCGCVGIPAPAPTEADAPRPALRLHATLASIRQQALALSPPGTPYPRVAAIMAAEMRSHGEERQWRIDNDTRLFLPSRYMSVTLHSYSLFVGLWVPSYESRRVNLHYHFDAKGRLLDIKVDKRQHRTMS